MAEHSLDLFDVSSAGEETSSYSSDAGDPRYAVNDGTDSEEDEANARIQNKFKNAILKKINEKEEEIKNKEKLEQDKERELRMALGSNSKPSEEILYLYKFDPFKEKYLKTITNPSGDFKIRVYILTCQNLCAVDNFVGGGIANRLAGDYALSSADPYPMVKIGNGENDSRTKKVKKYDDSTQSLDKTLNPQFYRSYELDATFPDDWELTIEIFDKNKYIANRIVGDTLIGRTVIDLEQRRFGLKYNQSKEIAKIVRQDLLQTKKQLEKELNDDGVRIKDVNKQLEYEEVLKEIEQLKDLDYRVNKDEKIPQIPVEYRPLKLPGKDQAQGIIEMWVEVLTHEEHRQLPMEKMSSGTKKEDYEIRLIVWETRDIPNLDGDSSDVYIKAIFYPDGLQTPPIEGMTDTHLGCKDGTAIFNYRLKFPLTMPADYPRIKLQVYDYNLLTGDTSIGETTLNIKGTVNILNKHGELEDKKVWLEFINPNNQGQSSGYVLVSLDILLAVEAEQNPVGRGQEEPNVNPTLTYPTEGRGLGAGIGAVTGLSLPSV